MVEDGAHTTALLPAAPCSIGGGVELSQHAHVCVWGRWQQDACCSHVWCCLQLCVCVLCSHVCV